MAKKFAKGIETLEPVLLELQNKETQAQASELEGLIPAFQVRKLTQVIQDGRVTVDQVKKLIDLEKITLTKQELDELLKEVLNSKNVADNMAEKFAEFI
eukprot:3905870-Karenia_brevis.AAC.1